MKKKCLLASFLFPAIILSQVGINTTTPDPSSALDVTSTNKGFLMPRVTLSSKTDAASIPSPATGLSVYNPTASLGMPVGVYFNTGTPSAPDWTTYQKQGNYVLDNIYEVSATAPVTFSVTGSNFSTNIQLLNLSVIIPPYTSSAKIVITYSTPLSTDGVNIDSGGYYGATLLKSTDGTSYTEFVSGSRKIGIPKLGTATSGTNYFNMSTIGATTVDTVSNNSAAPITLYYRLNAYVEQGMATGTTIPYRYNMFSANPFIPNYNWGRGNMTATVYVK